MKKENEQIAKTLVSLGLPDKEARLYAATLELGSGTVAQISLKAVVNRTNAYNILGSLVEKKLVRVSGKKPKETYAAETPDNLIAYFEERHQKTGTALSHARAFLPELKSIHRVGDRPQVKFYDGIDGLKEVYEDTLTAHDSILTYATVEDIQATLKNYFPKYYQRRASKGISTKAIVPDTSLSKKWVAHGKEAGTESVLVPSGAFRFSPEISVYDNKIMIASWHEKLGIIIESREVADVMKKVFKLAWMGAKNLNKKN